MGLFTLINDITTDLEDPPRFESVLATRPARANSVEHGGPVVAARQREAYPFVQPILTPLSPDEAFGRSLRIAEQMGWEIVARDSRKRVFEAVDTTRILRFKDDVAVRVRPAPEGSRVDLRSLSRIGRGDLGRNAARIAEFTERFARA